MTPSHLRSDLRAEATEQATEARVELFRPESDYLPLPFRSLHALVGGIGPGQVALVGAYTGTGITALLMSAVKRWLMDNRAVVYFGLETRPPILRTHLAALRLGLDPGEVLSGAAKAWSNWLEVRGELLADIERQRALGPGNQLLINDVPALDADGLEKALHDAALDGVDVVVIDHIDQLALAGVSNAYLASRIVAQRLLDAVHDYRLRALVATQLNHDAVRGDRLAPYRPPRPEHIYGGGHKLHMATFAIGLYRPMNPAATAEQLQAVMQGAAEPGTIVEPHTMGIVVMKHRFRGVSIGRCTKLRVERGAVADIQERDLHGTTHRELRRI